VCFLASWSTTVYQRQLIVRILITGASGFSGRFLAELGLRNGADVFSLSRSGGAAIGTSPLIADLNDADSIANVVRDTQPDAVVHLAAQTPANSPGLSPQEWVHSNAVATINLLEALRPYSPDARFLLVSSSAVYGHVPHTMMPIDEMVLPRPTTMYGVSKATQELIALRYAHEFGMQVVCARSFNLVGPGEPQSMLTSVLAVQVAAIKAGQTPAVVRMRHRATQRDFTDVRDAVRGYWDVLHHGIPGETYNICSGIATSIGSIADRLIALAGVQAVVETSADMPGRNDILVQQGNPAKLHALTGWQPEIDLDTSLADLLARSEKKNSAQ
jgi:GDP-4-dehydro-6-deoxy-D-mannose reductase